MRKCGAIYIKDNLVGIPDIHKTDLGIYAGNASFEFNKKEGRINSGGKIDLEHALSSSMATCPIMDLIWKKWTNPNSFDFNRATGLSACVVFDSVTISDYSVFIDQVDKDNYELTFVKKENHWAVNADSLKLCEITGLGSIAFTEANVTAIQTGQETYEDDGTGTVQFGLIDYGQFNGNKYNLLPDLSQFRPLVSPLWLLQRGFCQLGVDFKSPILETDEYRHMYAYLLDKDYGKNASALNNLDFHAEMTIPITSNPSGAIVLIFDNEISDPGNNYNVLTGHYAGAVTGDFCANVTIGMPSSALGIHLGLNIVRQCGATVEIIAREDIALVSSPTGTTQDFNICAKDLTNYSGCVIAVVITGPLLFGATIDSGNFSLTAKRAIYTEGDNIDIGPELSCNITLLDLFKGIAHVINGRFAFDESNNTLWLRQADPVELINGETPEAHYNGEVEVITEAVIQGSHLYSFDKSTLDRYHTFAFAPSTDAYIKDLIDNKILSEFDILHGRRHDLGSDYQTGEVENRNPLFEPTYLREFVDGAYIPVMVDNLEGDLSYNVGPRLLMNYGTHGSITFLGLTLLFSIFYHYPIGGGAGGSVLYGTGATTPYDV